MEKQSPKYDIFISYSRKDLSKVKKIVKDIESCAKCKCWIDLNGIESASQFRDVIVSAIDSVSIVLFMHSENSVASEFAKKEVLYAKEMQKRVVPINIDNSNMRGWFLFEFSGTDCIFYDVKEQREKLLKDIKMWCAKGDEDGEIKVPEVPVPKPRSTLWHRTLKKLWLPVVILAVFAICVCFYLGITESEKKELMSNIENRFPQKSFNWDNSISMTQLLTINEITEYMTNEGVVEGGSFAPGILSDTLSDVDSSMIVHVAPFYISQFELTNAQWYGIMGGEYDENNAQKPKTEVSYYDCIDYIDALNILTGLDFRLPTEAEWEYAARGGQNTKYSGSDDPKEVAWYLENSGGQTHDCGFESGLKYNRLGLFDMSGNVSEWCDTQSEIFDSAMVIRGGNFKSDIKHLSVIYRSQCAVNAKGESIGFRLVMSKD